MRRLIFAIFVIIGTSFGGFAENNALSPSEDNIVAQIPAQPTLKASSGQISLTVPADKTVKFYIYSITGQIVKTVSVSSGAAVVELPQGYYIVKCENWSKQAIVR